MARFTYIIVVNIVRGTKGFLDEAFKEFTKDMDSMLEKLGMEFGQQWEQQ